ncbi:Hypothetical protein FKW44_023021 [Caligus rogercresseyi]|uniref:Uncharacterized protein n=1 Tax=Caligus rogercresseyi TaxID=217165 RepID=A0A7T8GP76_CALRO|nr:Hypothetical protein FKW44_023021 [Caligus rogercresseyi]
MVPLRLVYKVSSNRVISIIQLLAAENGDTRLSLLLGLARRVNEIHGDLLSTFPDSCPGLSTLQRLHTGARFSTPRVKQTARKTIIMMGSPAS